MEIKNDSGFGIWSYLGTDLLNSELKYKYGGENQMFFYGILFWPHALNNG